MARTKLRTSLRSFSASAPLNAPKGARSNPTLSVTKKGALTDSFFCDGESGIRTHAPFRTNGFQDRLVMTTSISLQFHHAFACVMDILPPGFRFCQHTVILMSALLCNGMFRPDWTAARIWLPDLQTFPAHRSSHRPLCDKRNWYTAGHRSFR